MDAVAVVEFARQLLQSESRHAERAQLPLAAADARAVAWALKDLCYDAWRGAPPQAAVAAQALQALSAGFSGSSELEAAAAREIEALVLWTDGISCLTRGEMESAIQALDAAAVALRGVDQADAAAQTQVPKIMALSMLGRHEQAAACGEASLRELLALGNRHAAARVSQNLGSLHARLDAYAKAERCFAEAAVLFARLGDHAHSVFADIGRANALTDMGDFDEALRLYARARMRAQTHALALPLALVDEAVASLDLARGSYRQALAGFESARRRYDTLALPHYLAICEKQLADAYLELRLLPESLAMFDAAVARFSALALPDEQAWALAQRGRAQALLHDPAADASFAAAAALFEAQGNPVGQSAVALARAELALTAHDGAAALVLARRAADGYGQAAQADGRARAAVVQAQALLATGRADDARAAYALTLERAQTLQQLTVQVRCQSGLGMAAQAMGDAPAAVRAFDAAIDLFEEQRRALPGDDIRSAFLMDHLQPYRERLRLALSNDPAALVLWHLDRFRARALDERLDERVDERLDEQAAAAGSAAGPADDDAIALRQRLNWLYRRVQRLQDEAEDVSVLQTELLRTERELLERARRRRLAAPLWVKAAGTSWEFSVAALQAALSADDVLVEYGVLDDELFACVVTADRVDVRRRLAAFTDVVDGLRSARFQIETLRHGASMVSTHLDVLTARASLRLSRLQERVWAPLADLIPAGARVLIVPHAQLGALPFAALPTSATEARALGERHAIAIAPSARAALRGLRRPSLPARSAVVLGESTRLPHAGKEAVQVAALFSSSMVLTGDDATVERLRLHAPTADVLHLACHAEFRSDNPRFSALHLHDAVLTVDDAETLRLRPCTVVLSACETGLAEAGHGDDMVGLVRAFLVAGAARVVASLWPVDDRITADFMATFYRGLAAGKGAAAALQHAQADVRRVHPHPHFWGAFTLYGGW